VTVPWRSVMIAGCGARSVALAKKGLLMKRRTTRLGRLLRAAVIGAVVATVAWGGAAFAGSGNRGGAELPQPEGHYWSAPTTAGRSVR
jgi:hypothetical protein